MSAKQSHLSLPELGYDLVVASTQKSLNAALKRYLDSLNGAPVTACYVYDDNNEPISIPYELLKTKAKGSDPFTIAEDADPKTNQDLLNLAEAGFAGGFRATIGLPDMPLDKLPPVVTLAPGLNAPVTFNLLSSDFRIAGFNYGPRGSIKWVDAAQSPDDPWYFTSQIELNRDTIDPNSPVPPEVQRKIQELINSVGEDAFSIERLFLDLDTAILLTAPSINGISAKDWPVWGLLTSIFLDAYLGELRQVGDPVLGYMCTVDTPKAATLPIRAITRECCAVVDSGGQPVVDPTHEQQDAVTLNYLCSVTDKKPVATRIPWNWVEPSELGRFSGVQAVRRDVFIAHLQHVFNELVDPISFAPAVEWIQKESNGMVRLQIDVPLTKVANFAAVPIAAPSLTTGTKVLNLDYSKPAHACLWPAGIGYLGDWFSYRMDYKLTGDVTALVIDGTPCIKLRLAASCFEEAQHTEVGIATYDDQPGAKYVDMAVEAIFQISVTADGQLVVSNPIPTVADTSAPWVFYSKGIRGVFTQYESYIVARVKPVHEVIKSTLSASFKSISANLQTILNNSQSWVFPGSRTFVFSDVLFSDHLDFVTHTTYAAPA